MGRFVTKLDATLIDASYSEYNDKWMLNESLGFRSDVLNDLIVVPRFFVTDLESCPRIPGAFLLFGNVAKASAVIHDYLYTVPTICSRKMADDVLYEACIAEGVSKWRAWGIWAGVRLGGGSHYGDKV